jgi:hypothetical protein
MESTTIAYAARRQGHHQVNGRDLDQVQDLDQRVGVDAGQLALAGWSPDSARKAAGARSHCPRHGLGSQVAPPLSFPCAPTFSVRASISLSEPADRQARSLQTLSTRNGRGSTENSA